VAPLHLGGDRRQPGLHLAALAVGRSEGSDQPGLVERGEILPAPPAQRAVYEHVCSTLARRM
jgi:hypothetical protein